jgi:L-lactate dehydrogenase complex protein LldG
MSTPNDSRAKILGSIRQSLQGARHLPVAPQVTLPPPGAPAGPLAERFASELGQLSGKCVWLPAAEVAGWLLGLMRERGARDLLAWQAADLPVPGVLAALQAGGITLVDSTLPHAEPARSAALARVEQVSFGLTGADAGFAETGTLALTAGAGRPRLASLSVRTHVALLDPKRLFTSWAAWLEAEGAGAVQRLAGTSNLTLVTGPSRTGDIEMTLTVGVHGPGEVIVVLVS